VAKVRWNLRLNPRIPGTELRIRSVCCESHSQYSITASNNGSAPASSHIRTGDAGSRA
jgi:hypothetical protein